MEQKPTPPAAHAGVAFAPDGKCYLCLASSGSSITTRSLAEAHFWHGAGYVIRLLTGRLP